MTSGLATLAELDTIYSVEDVYIMMEVSLINSYNQRLFQKFYAAKAQEP